MVQFDPNAHKVVIATSNNPKDDLPLSAKILLGRMLGEMGVFQVTPGNTPPTDKDVLWWHQDVQQFKRYNAVLGNWSPITGNAVAMHLFRRAILGSTSEVTLENNDLFCFWDDSVGEVKKISRNDLAAAILGTLTTTEGVQGGGLTNGNRTIKLDINGLTAKTVPAGTDTVAIYSVANNAHRKSTIEQIAASVASSDAIFLDMYFLGNI